MPDASSPVPRPAMPGDGSSLITSLAAAAKGAVSVGSVRRSFAPWRIPRRSP